MKYICVRCQKLIIDDDGILVNNGNYGIMRSYHKDCFNNLPEYEKRQ